MYMLSIINNNEIKDELTEFREKHGISDDDIICSIIYEFARNLPYSMDYMDEDFVPGVFLNVSPTNPTKWIFQDYSSLYYKMINWSDTRKSGIFLQICNIFQTVLMGKFPNNYQLTEEDFYNLGISQMTSDENYNRFIFETLQMLPEYCIKLNSIENSNERRKLLDDIYTIILDRVGQKIGGFRITTENQNIITSLEHEATIRLRPHKDLDMLYYFEGINIDFNVRNLIDNINKKINIETNLNNQNTSLESRTNNKRLTKQ